MSVQIESNKLISSELSSSVSIDSNYFSNLTRSDSDSSNSTFNSTISTFSSLSSSINPSQSISSTTTSSSSSSSSSLSQLSSSSTTKLYSESEDNSLSKTIPIQHQHQHQHQSITSILNKISSQTDLHHHHHQDDDDVDHPDDKFSKSQSTPITSSTRNHPHQLPSPAISFRLYSIQSNVSKTSISSTSPTSLSPKNLLKSTHINSIHQQLQQDLLLQDPLVSPHTNYSNLDLFSHSSLSPSIQNWSDVPTPTSSVIAKRFSFLAELGIGDAAAEAASILFQTQSVSTTTKTTPSPTASSNTNNSNNNDNINNNNTPTNKATLVEKEPNLPINSATSVDKSDEYDSNNQSLLLPNKQSPSSLTYSARFRPESCWIQSSGYGELRLIKPLTTSTHSLPIETKEDQNDHQRYQELYEETQSNHLKVQSDPVEIESKPSEEIAQQDQETSNQNENQHSTRSTSFAQHVRRISLSSNKLKDRFPPRPLKINSLPIPKRNTILVAESQDQAYDSGSEQVIVESPSNLKPNVTSNRAEIHTWLNRDPYPTSGSTSDQKTASKPTIPKLTTNLSTEISTQTSSSSPSTKPQSQTVNSPLTRSKTHHVPINKTRPKPNSTKVTILESVRHSRSSSSSPLSGTDPIHKSSTYPTLSSSSTPKTKNDSKKVSPTNSIHNQSTPTKRRKSLFQFFKSAIQSSTPTPSPTPSTTPETIVRPTLQRRSTRDCAPPHVPAIATVRRTRSHSHATLNSVNKSPTSLKHPSDSLYDDQDQLELVRSPFIKEIRKKNSKELMDVLLDVTDDNTFIKLAIENKSSSSTSSPHHSLDDHLSLSKIGRSELHHLFIIRELIKSEKSYLEHLISLQEAVEQANQSAIKTTKSLQRASLYYLPNPTLQSTNTTTITITKRSNSTNTSILTPLNKFKILQSQLPLLINLSKTLIERISNSPTIKGISKTFIGLEPNFESIFLGWIKLLNRIKFDFKDLRVSSSTPTSSASNGGTKCNKNDKNSRLSWNDILIMPVQRVTRYHLFLTELMKSEKNLIQSSLSNSLTPSTSISSSERNDESLVNLKIALDRSKSLAEVCNVQV